MEEDLLGRMILMSNLLKEKKTEVGIYQYYRLTLKMSHTYEKFENLVIKKFKKKKIHYA